MIVITPVERMGFSDGWNHRETSMLWIDPELGRQYRMMFRLGDQLRNACNVIGAIVVIVLMTVRF